MVTIIRHISKTEHNLAVKFHMAYTRKIWTIFLIPKSQKVLKQVEAIHELYHAPLILYFRAVYTHDTMC